MKTQIWMNDKIIDVAMNSPEIISNGTVIKIIGGVGPQGYGVPSGGTTGQVLAKSANDDYITEWKSVSDYLGSYIRNTDFATDTKAGIVKVESNSGLMMNANTGGIETVAAPAADIKGGVGAKKPITPSTQDAATFYGLAKAAGDWTQSVSANAVGTYTDDAKEAIQAMLGISPTSDSPVESGAGVGSAKTKDYTVSDVTYSNSAYGIAAFAEGENTTAGGRASHAEGVGTVIDYWGNGAHAEGYYTTANGSASHAEGWRTTAEGGAHVEGNYSIARFGGAHAEGTDALADAPDAHAEGTQTIAYAESSHVGGRFNVADSNNSFPVWTANTSYAVGDIVKITSGNNVVAYICDEANNDAEFDEYKWHTYNLMHYAEIIGNGTAKNARSNAYALDWDGNAHYKGDIYVGCNADSSGGTKLPRDVQVNGTSVVTDGIAEIPTGSTSVYGVYKSGSVNNIKAGASLDTVPVVGRQYASTFYGLAAAAGDSTQSASSNEVGNYTDAAKAAIQHMLGTDTNLGPYESDTTADQAYAIGDLFILNGKLHRATAAIAIGDTFVVGTNCTITQISNTIEDIRTDAIDVVEDWIDENLSQETGYVIDTSLTVTGAAADAKAVGDNVSELKSQIEDLDENLYTDSEVVAGGSTEFTDTNTFNPGLGNIRYFSETFEDEYSINKLKLRAYKNTNAAYTFKLITVEFLNNMVYVRKVGSEIVLDAPTDAYTDYIITLDTPFSVPAGQMVGVCASDDKWLYYSESGSEDTYYVRTQSYSDVVADFRLQTYLPLLYTGKLPITFYSGGKEFIHIFRQEEIEEIVDEKTEELSGEINSVAVRVDELAENKNIASTMWQTGVWQNNSSDSVAANDHFICTNNAVPKSAGTIINDDAANYKYVITGYDMNATYHGKGTYNASTGVFEMYVNNYITAKEFDLDALRKKFPAFEFRISLCKTTDAPITVSAYSFLRFMAYRSYDKGYIDNAISVNKAIYVSIDGDDTNSGKLSSEPVLSVNRALELGATDILVSGGVYEQTIDLSKCNNPFVRIKNITATGRVIFYAPDSLIASSETHVSGYTKVYSASTTHTFPQTTSKIFQDGVADASTEIQNPDRHPIQRGSFYRCEDTKINKCTSDTLSEALNEIENADTFKWYYDNGTIYFSRPQEITAAHPLRTGLYSTVFLENGTREKTVEMIGIECKYMRLDLSLSSARVVDCKVSNACGAGIRYDNGIAIELIRCEVENAYSGTLGDGIGATGTSSYGMAKGTTISMIDCWAHDNNDDGFSDHVGCESTIIGGLYEYNGKGGVLPTGGGSCTCYNVTSRRNAIGFEIAGGDGPVASGRNGQQIECHGCVADGNTQYGYYVAGNQDMTMRLVDCIALNNGTGYSGSTATGSDLIAINCAGYGNTTLKGQAVTVITAEDLM